MEAGKNAQVTEALMVNARIERQVCGKGSSDAVNRGRAYVDAVADGIMIHSKGKSGDDIKEFCTIFRNTFNKSTPLVVVPSTYNQITEDEFIKWGANIVIYANHMLRSAYPAMLETAKLILENGRSLEADMFCMPIKEILELIPGTK